MFNKEKLVDLMNERELSLADVSKMSGVAYSTLRDLYTGKNKNPLANTLRKISQGLNVEADYFINDEIEDISQLDKKVDESGIKTIAAHFETEDFTDEDLKDIKNFINYIVSKKKK